MKSVWKCSFLSGVCCEPKLEVDTMRVLSCNPHKLVHLVQCVVDRAVLPASRGGLRV